MSDALPIQNGLKQGDDLPLMLWNMASGRTGSEWNTSGPDLC